jgi:polysaccharide biosynthesis transport protein
MSLQQLLIIFKARIWLVIVYLVFTMSVTLGLSLMMSKKYVASTSLVLDQPGINPITRESLPIQVTASYMATQSDIIKSPAVSLLVVDILGLKQDKTYQDSFQKDKLGGDFHKLDREFTQWIAEGLIKELEVLPSRESSILSISITDKDPEFAAKVANAYAQAYIQMADELKRQPAQQTADWFDGQLKMLGERRDKVQEKFSAFQQKHGIVATTNERIDLEETKLNELSDQLVKNQLETADLTAKKKLLTETLDNPEALKSFPVVLSSPVLNELKTGLARSQAKFADLALHVDKNHPQYRQAEAELISLKAQIKAEMNTLLHGFNNSILASKKRDENLAKAFAEQKSKVLALKEAHIELAAFKRELENAQTAYDAVMQRSIQMRMESEIRQSNIAVLDQAVAPKVHSSPKITSNMIISVLLGSILGIGAAFFAEILDRRVRSPADIIDVLDLPVFGVISRPHPVKKFSGSFFGVSF